MKNKLLGAILVLSVMTAGLAGCSGEYKGFKKTDSGIYYRIHTKGNDDTNMVRVGKIVSLDMTYGPKDSILFDNKGLNTVIKFKVSEPGYPGDIYDALTLLAQGDSATFILDATKFFTQTAQQPAPPPFIKEGDMMYFGILVKKVQTDAEVEAENQARLDSLRALEPSMIANFIAERGYTVQPDSNGIYFIELQKGSGNAPVRDMWISVHYSVFMLNGYQLFSSRERAMEPMDFQLGRRFENDGFQMVVERMRKNGIAQAVVPSALAFGEQGAGDVVPPFTPLYYEIEVLDIMTMEQWDRKQSDKKVAEAIAKDKKAAEEKTAIANYLKDNNLTPTTQLPTGITYVEKVRGSGPMPKIGDKVKVHYTGTLLNGTKFDSSLDGGQPLEFTIGRGEVIMGWDKGIALMTVGSKGILIVPFDQGYGAQGGGPIPPYSTLVFDLELLEIVPAN